MAFAHPFFLLWALLLSLPAGAGSVFNPAVKEAYTETISLRIGEGRRLLARELQENPSNAVALLVANQQDFLTWAVQQNPTTYTGILARQEKRLQQLSSLKERSAWVGYSIAEVKLQIGLSKLLYGSKLAAAWDIRQAYLQYAENARRYPQFLPNRKTLGALQVLIGSVPESYRVFLNIIGMQGDIKTGMANLHAASSQTNPFQEEAQLLHALLSHLVNPDTDENSAESLYLLSKANPDNLLFQFVAIHILKKTKKSDLALQVYQRRPVGQQYIAFPYLHHMAGDLYLYKGDFERSVKLYQLFLSQHKGLHYLKASHFKLYLAYWLNQEHNKAEQHYRKISELGQTDMEEDAYAARFVKDQEAPNRYLMLARLQSDGGYYKEALTVINRMPQASSLTEKAEYLYRKARIYHGMDNLLQAKRFYEQAIEASRNTSLYYAPYSALQLGYICLEQGQREIAKAWFDRALSYKGHEYKNSIDSKAKLALQAL